MIPQRCYSDIYELVRLLKTDRAEGKVGVPMWDIIQRLEDLVWKWKVRDEIELYEMYRESEGGKE